MAKLTLNTIGSRYGSIDALNDNFDAIEQALENTFSLDGTSPNALEADLDMNSNDILNAGEVSTDTLRINGVLVEPLTGVTAGAVFQTYEFTATAGQTTFSVSPATPYNASIVVIVNGLQLSPAEISVSGTNVITPALTLGDEVVIRRYTAEPVASPDASEINFIQAGTGAVTRTSQNKMRESVSVLDFGILVDGITNQTSALLTLLSSLSASAYRGIVNIPYNTKFDVAAVYAAVPLGVILKDESSINWGQPPSYKNKFLITYSGDNVSDDTQEIIASPHHPALMFLNMGTDVSAAAASRYATILHGVGKDYAGDPLLGWIYQFAKDPSAAQWRTSMRLQTPYNVAIKNPQPWITATVYAANSYCVSDGGKIYTTVAGGTSGVTAPTGTGGSISDGGVTWSYSQAALNIDSTRFDWFEDGKTGQYAPTNGTVRHTQVAGVKSWYLELDDSTGTITARDVTRSLNIFAVSTAAGFEIGTAQSLNRLSITGTGPNAPVTGAGKVENGSATNMSTMVPPVGRTKMIVNLRFDNSNTTLVHGTGTNNLTLKGATNVTPSVGQFITFEYDSTLSTRWFETSRSF